MRIRISTRLLAVLGMAVAACTAGSADRESATRSGVTNRRIILVGLDAADWLAIDPMVAAGALPTFARLAAGGRTAVMVSTPPLVSPILWTTIATGLPPERHRVLDFMVDLPNGAQSPVRSTDRRGPALWNLFSAAGQRVGVVGWWATWPAERLHGTIVTDALAPQLAQDARPIDSEVVWPAAATTRATRYVVRPEQITRQELAEYIPLTDQEYVQARKAATSASRLYENPITHLAAVVASERTYTAAALDTITSDPPDFLAVYFEAIDSVSHMFVRDARRGPGVIARAYRDADELIRRLSAASPPDTLIVICSDHGFYPATAGIAEDPANLTGAATAWHRPYGIAAVATAGVLSGRVPPVHQNHRDATVVPLDIAPTVLHAAGLPLTTDMTGRVVTELLPEDVAAKPVQRKPAPPAATEVRASDESRPAASELARLRSLGYVASSGPGTSLARRNLGEVLFRRGDFEGAERELRAVLEAQPANVTAMLWLAKTLAAQQRPADALTAYERVVTLPGGARDGIVEGVALAIASGHADRGLRMVNAARNAPDAAAVVAVARGDLAEARGDHAAAERAYREALSTDPACFDAAARLFDQLAHGRRAADAVPVLSAAVKAAPDSPRHLALLGDAKLSAGDAPGAERALSRALQLAPDGAAVRLDLARAQLVQHKTSEALRTLEPAPISSERQALIGAALSAERKWAEAAVALEDASRLGMTTVEVLNQLGWALLQLGRRDEAAAALTRSLSLRGDQPEIRKLLAAARPEAGRTR